MSITKGQLIIRCLKHLGEYDPVYVDDGNDNRVLYDDSEEISAKEEYADRVLPIIESINRAFHRLGQLKKLPSKSYVVNYDQNRVGNTITLTDDSTNNFYVNKISYIKNVLKKDQHGNVETNTSYFIDGDIIILPQLCSGESYTIIYQPVYEDISVDTLDTSTIDYPEYVLQCIPYYVKADVYQEDNASISVLERNTFEAYASQIPSRNETIIRDPMDVYGIIEAKDSDKGWKDFFKGR